MVSEPAGDPHPGEAGLGKGGDVLLGSENPRLLSPGLQAGCCDCLDCSLELGGKDSPALCGLWGCDGGEVAQVIGEVFKMYTG